MNGDKSTHDYRKRHRFRYIQQLCLVTYSPITYLIQDFRRAYFVICYIRQWTISVFRTQTCQQKANNDNLISCHLLNGFFIIGWHACDVFTMLTFYKYGSTDNICKYPHLFHHLLELNLEYDVSVTLYLMYVGVSKSSYINEYTNGCLH